jgi:carotenoid cleavage dioxygenase-like enzyme
MHQRSGLLQLGRSPDQVTVKPESLVPEHLEFPRFNYTLVGQKNQFFYALGNDYLHPNRVSREG